MSKNMNCIDYLKDISLSKDEEKAFNKYKNTLRINNIILLLFILFICIILPIGVSRAVGSSHGSYP